MKRVRIGIIGLGYIGKIHLRNASRHRIANLQVEAVADVSKRELNEAKKVGVRKTYTDYTSLLQDPNVDAVVIGLPTHLHTDCAKKAAENGKHIMLEKPIAPNISDAKQIISAAKNNSVKLMMGYPLRFNQSMLNLRNRLNSGELGDIVTAYATNISSGPFMHRSIGQSPVPVPEWWFNKELIGGGVLTDLGSHMINLLRWYFGEVKYITSHLGYRFNMELEDHAICIAQFESGTKAIINLGWYSQKYQQKIELIGTNGHAISDIVPPNIVSAAIQMLLLNTTKFWQPYSAELEYFARSIIEDFTPSPTGYDGLKDIEAIYLAYQNAEQMH
jgi:UDP-N-acetylglucosamine 3-dehydrogenase